MNHDTDCSDPECYQALSSTRKRYEARTNPPDLHIEPTPVARFSTVDLVFSQSSMHCDRRDHSIFHVSRTCAPSFSPREGGREEGREGGEGGGEREGGKGRREVDRGNEGEKVGDNHKQATTTEVN